MYKFIFNFIIFYIKKKINNETDCFSSFRELTVL